MKSIVNKISESFYDNSKSGRNAKFDSWIEKYLKNYKGLDKIDVDKYQYTTMGGVVFDLLPYMNNIVKLDPLKVVFQSAVGSRPPSVDDSKIFGFFRDAKYKWYNFLVLRSSDAMNTGEHVMSHFAIDKHMIYLIIGNHQYHQDWKQKLFYENF